MADLGQGDSDVKSRGRNRFCKTCKFSSTDAKEFQHHQMYAHNAEENKALDKEIHSNKIEPRRKSLNSANKSPRLSREDSDNSSISKSSLDKKPPSEHSNSNLNGTSEEEIEQMKLSNMEEFSFQKSSPVPVKRTGNIQTRNYVCSKCSFDTTSAQVYLHHQVDEHQENISIFECDLCDYATKYKQKLPRHRKLHFTARDLTDTPDMDFSVISAASDADNTDDPGEGTDYVDGMARFNENKNSTMNNGLIELGLEDLDGSDRMDESDALEIATNEMEEEEGTMEPETKPKTFSPSIVQPAPVTPASTEMPRKKAPRQEVDPRKYVVIRSEKGVKFACSRCTSIYSWRKSLNKHWKEKHPGDLPDAKIKAQKLAELSESSPGEVSASTFRGNRSFSNFGPPMTSSPVLNIPRSRSSTPLSGTGLPTNTSNYHHNFFQPAENYHAPPMPNVIGPFVTNSIQPTYINELSEDQPKDFIEKMQPRILDLSRSSKQEYLDESDMDESEQNEPLDFSCKQNSFDKSPSNVRALLENGSLEGQYLYNKYHVKPEPAWSGDENDNFKRDNLNVEKPIKESPQKSNRNHVLQCSRCAYVAKTLVDYSAHMGIHLNKKAFKCAECQEHFGAVDDLNSHFAENHSDKILKHKEAIQKIPHGLLQTYHLLNVPVNKLSGLSNNSYTQTGDKQLKCNMCGFVARWPAELQKHAVSHSEERPFVCMVCGSTYKWKWDLVKHFEKSHHTLPNPYKRRDPGSQQSPSSSFSTSTAAALVDNDSRMPVADDDSASSDSEPTKKRRRLSDSDLSILKAKAADLAAAAADTNNNKEEEDIEEPSDDCRLLSQEYENEYLAALEMRRATADELKLRGYNIDGMSGEGMEGDMEFDPEDPEPYMQSCRPINAATQKIIVETLKQRISQGKTLSSREEKLLSAGDNQSSSADILLPYKCPSCEYRARWPSEITQHMKNHSDEKPFRCPRCSYRSKWKWDVVKHLKRCGGGTIKDVIDTTLEENMEYSSKSTAMSYGNMIRQGKPACPNVTVLPSSAAGLIGSPAVPMNQNSEDTLSPNSMSQNHVKQPIFRGLINDGMHHCLHCPFVGQSPAELKRHSMIHAEDRPFTCATCGYSSKWKGDLKKHLRTYNHAGARPILPRPESEDFNNSQSEDSQGGDRLSMLFHDKLLFKCNRCPYVTYKKTAYDSHLKIHGTSSNADGPSKFKCKQCQFQAQDLSTFLQHRVTHTQASQMTVPTKKPVSPQSFDNEVSSRTLHLKYRRKPVKQFKCNKCPYVCFKKSGLDLHEAMHEPRGVDAHTCLFCDYNVYSKNLLMQHMRLHSEYDPAIHSHLIGDVDKDAQEQFDDYENTDDGIIDLTANTNYVYNTPHLPIPQPKLDSPPTLKKALPCEWCPASFDHLLDLFNHAQTMHPQDLQAQGKPVETSSSNPLDFSNKVNSLKSFTALKPGASLLGGNKQNSKLMMNNFVTPKSYQPIMPKKPDGSQSHPEHGKQSWLLNARKTTHSPTAARKSTSPAKRSPRHQCTKCPFIASNLFSYYRHMERHGSNCKHTCSYCDYSINRLNLLYQHMKGAHNIYWYSGDGKSSSETKPNVDRNQLTPGELSRTSTPSTTIPSPTGSSASQDFDIPPSSVSPNSSFGAEPMEEVPSDFSLEKALLNSELKKKLPTARKPGSKPTLVIVEETNWRGIPIQICFLDGRKNYKCPLCNYISNNAANATNHVRQHGTNRRYRCDYCNYSVDNLRLVYHHMESIHRNCPYNTVERFEKSGSIENMDESSMNDDTNSVGTAEDIANNVLDSKVITQLETAFSQNPMNTGKPLKEEPPRRSIKCSFCPFRAKNRDSYTKHLEMHELSGRYKCKHCSYSADRLNLMTQHSRVHDEAGLPDPLPKSVNSPSLSRMAKHPHSNMNSRANGRIRYRCSRCPFKTFCKSNIIKHRRQHLVNGKYKCPKCNYSAMRWYVLQQHLKFHDPETPENGSKPQKDFQDFVLDPNDEKAAEALKQAEPGTLPGTEQPEEMSTDTAADCTSEMTDFDSEQDMEEFDDLDSAADSVMPNEQEILEAESNNLECKSCPFTAMSVIEYHKHARCHKLSMKFRCDLCKYSNDRLNTVLMHRKVHTEDPDYMEDVPAETLVNPDFVENNVPESSPNNTDSADSGVEKLMVRSGSMSEESKRFTCSMCPHQCNTVKNLNTHMARHSRNGKFICDCCSWSSNRLNFVYEHRVVHSKEPDFDQSPEDIKFLNRDFVDDGSSSPTLEMSEESTGEAAPEEDEESEMITEDSISESDKKNIHLKRLHNCSICPFSCNSKSSFTYHQTLHEVRARYTCSHCSYSVARWNLLRQHMQLHESPANQPQKRLKCPTCPYHTRSKELLDAHIAMHSAGKKYKCDFCSYSSEQYSLLQQHLKVHSTIKVETKDSPDLKSSELKVFEPNESGMSRSLLYFRGSKPSNEDPSDIVEAEFKCERCPFDCSSQEELGAHEKRHDENNKADCPCCDYSCPELEELLDHVRVHFPGSQIDMAGLQSLMAKKGKKKTDNGNKESNSTAKDEPEKQQESVEADPDKAETDQTDQPPKEMKRTKVYVCQYCDREFEDKVLMRDHENQHLIGSQY